ncbi:GNAT family N-acetyltransferase [Xylanibacillus composti]|uniref:N-acetyltransferase domain-containing protein n=1 Tax=Xylanibacillus composti TaxID=1572762 RepID=A0A8J4M0N1_9BACL|nr:GNAT family N-acetyltransferase [Xylanibacillus composti]MDT9725561.1 GNAT family N-acetyltransferase [Xylanibacillus composti]GIQ67654.1 hypothetical protein XYCOK13_04780 [Xylanibacillus composti]
MIYTYFLTEDPTTIQEAKQLLYDVLFKPLQMSDTMQDQLKIQGEELYFVAMNERTEVVGVMVLVIDGEHVELHHAATRTALQGQGIGKQLWILVHEYCTDRGFKSIELVSRNTAMSFWASVGFQATTEDWIEREDFVKHGIRHKAMKQTL